MERPRSHSDEGTCLSRSPSVSAKCKNWFQSIFVKPDRKTSDPWDDKVPAIRPGNTKVVFKPDRRFCGPTDQYYNTNHKSRGKVYIFNHLKFKKFDSTRTGTMKDVEKLKRSLPKLGFKSEDIICFQDLTLIQIEEKLEEISNDDYTDSDMLVIFILTHGQKEGKIYAHDREYCLQEVWDHFTADKCTTLKGKPKIFFVIACKGDNMDDGTLIQIRKPSLTEIDSVRLRPTAFYRIPIWADFLTIYSTMEGFYSYRHPEDGTWYIQAFCDELINFSEPQMHFIDFITKVNQSVAIFYQTLFAEPHLNNKKQCPFINSSLTKVLCLKIASDQPQTDETSVTN